MKLSRRQLFALLAGAALDPEKLLWRPGRKLISIPAPSVNLWIRRFEAMYVMPPNSISFPFTPGFVYYKGNKYSTIAEAMRSRDNS